MNEITSILQIIFLSYSYTREFYWKCNWQHIRIGSGNDSNKSRVLPIYNPMTPFHNEIHIHMIKIDYNIVHMYAYSARQNYWPVTLVPMT